jgi:ribosomal protein S18 acetylase RimI-like enzyme
MTSATGRDHGEPSGIKPNLLVRLLTPDDVAAVAEVWHESKHQAYPFLPLQQGLTLQDDERIFRERILPTCDIWVASHDDTVVAFLALQGSYVDRLYVHPAHQGRGIGSRLMEQAKSLSPVGLELYTHQKNLQARAFYESHGFQAVRFGISPPPENEPDVEYHWRPERAQRS